MSNFIEFYSDEDSYVLMGGNTETSKNKYFAALCFMDKENKFVNIFLTRKQLFDLQQLISRNIPFIDAEHEKNEMVIKEIEENLRRRENEEDLLIIDCFDNNSL